MKENIKYIFSPRSVAVIGASTRPGSVGNVTFANILLNGYTGIVYPVNPKVPSVLGVKAYNSVLHVPDEIDLAIIIVPAASVPMVIEECGQKGIKGAVVITAGFKEIGESGKKLERRVKEIAQKNNVSLIGPNCFGIINSDRNISLVATFGKSVPPEGNIAFISQSGAVGISALEYAQAEGIGLSKFASIGNKADLNENDLLEYLKSDLQTKIILLYLEDLVNPHEFLKIAREITGEVGKPILAIKSGRTAEGAKAASSHTGALAGSDEIYNAFFNQCGIIRVETVSELFDFAKAFSGQPLPQGRRCAIITNAGGTGIMATDAIIRNGLELAKFTNETRNTLSKFLPPVANINNPVDIIGDADEHRYRQTLLTVLADNNVDSLLAIWVPTLMAETKAIAGVIKEVSSNFSKPIMGCLLSLENTKDVIRTLWQAKIPYYMSPEIAAKTLSSMCNFSDWIARPRTEVKIFNDVNRDEVRKIIENARRRKPPSILEPEAYSILSAYRIPVLPYALVKDVNEGLEKIKTIGYPCVIKIVSSDILHKTEVGGVLLDIETEEEFISKFNQLLDNVKKAKPEANITGILIQKMVSGGVETIMGVNKDPQFGPVIMFGLGGIYVEVLKDVSFRICPIKELSAEHMITEIKGYKILKGFRGRRAADIKIIQESLQRLSQLAVEFTEFSEIDINPFIVYEENNGGAALDARFLL